MISIFYIAVIFSHSQLVFSADCELPWVELGSKCLWKNSTLATRTDNLKYCRSVGATLVTPRTLEENELVKKFIENEPNWYWLSGQVHTKGDPEFRWIDGSAITYSDWTPGDPNQYSSDRPACLNVHPIEGWFDAFCDAELAQMCEKIIKAPPKSEEQSKLDVHVYEQEIEALKKKTAEQEIKIKTLEDHADYSKLIIVRSEE